VDNSRRSGWPTFGIGTASGQRMLMVVTALFVVVTTLELLEIFLKR
jgi:hypothetical protein